MVVIATVAVRMEAFKMNHEVKVEDVAGLRWTEPPQGNLNEDAGLLRKRGPAEAGTSYQWRQPMAGYVPHRWDVVR